MFNHRQGPITAYFDAESKISVLKSNQAFVKGSEIFMSYGSRPNQDLFLYSGFVDSLNTSNDRIKIFLTIQNQDKRRDERIKLLKLYGLSTFN